jgi:hypothetical protein
MPCSVKSEALANDRYWDHWDFLCAAMDRLGSPSNRSGGIGVIEIQGQLTRHARWSVSGDGSGNVGRFTPAAS